ncbi:putative aldo/keto reductase [Seiridium cupressi]
MLWQQVILSVFTATIVSSHRVVSTEATGFVVEANPTTTTHVLDCVKAVCVATKRAEYARFVSVLHLHWMDGSHVRRDSSGTSYDKMEHVVTYVPEPPALRGQENILTFPGLQPVLVTSGVDKLAGAATAMGDATTGGGASNTGSSATVTGGGTLTSGSQSSTATGNATNDAAAKGAWPRLRGFSYFKPETLLAPAIRVLWSTLSTWTLAPTLAKSAYHDEIPHYSPAWGKIKHIGLCGLSSNTLRRACRIAPVAAIQVEYSLFMLNIEREAGTQLLSTCRELGVSVVCYSPLGRGMLTSTFADNNVVIARADIRLAWIPRFQKENLDANMRLAKQFKDFADKKGCTASQLALAWLLKQGNDILPIPGTKSIKHLKDNLGAAHISLTDEEEAEVRKFVEGV